MLLWLLIGSHAKVEDLRGTLLTLCMVLGISVTLVRHYNYSDCSDSDWLHKIPLYRQHYAVMKLWAKCGTRDAENEF